MCFDDRFPGFIYNAVINVRNKFNDSENRKGRTYNYVDIWNVNYALFNGNIEKMTLPTGVPANVSWNVVVIDASIYQKFSFLTSDCCSG